MNNVEIETYSTVGKLLNVNVSVSLTVHCWQCQVSDSIFSSRESADYRGLKSKAPLFFFTFTLKLKNLHNWLEVLWQLNQVNMLFFLMKIYLYYHIILKIEWGDKLRRFSLMSRLTSCMRTVINQLNDSNQSWGSKVWTNEITRRWLEGACSI